MQPWAWPALQVLPSERAHRSVHSPQQPGILAMKETAGGQRPPSTLLTSAAMYFYYGVSFIYQYFCFSNNLMETMCQLNCLLIIPGTWAHQCNSLAMLLGCSPWGRKESDTTERLPFHFSLSCIGKEMATHSSVLAWRIPGTAAPGGLPSMGSHRVGHNWSDLAAAAMLIKYLNCTNTYRN